MCEEYKNIGVSVFLSLVKGNVQKVLVRGGFYDKFDKNNVFLTIHDAVLAALRRHPALLTAIILDAPFYPVTNKSPSHRGSSAGKEAPAGATSILTFFWCV